MPKYTIKDYIDAGYSFTFSVDDMGKYNGLLNGRESRIYLTEQNLLDLKEYENIYNLLKNSFRIIKINGGENHYVLQMLDLHYEGPYNEMSYYLLEDIEAAPTIEELLKKYDDMKKETNVNSLK